MQKSTRLLKKYVIQQGDEYNLVNNVCKIGTTKKMLIVLIMHHPYPHNYFC
jgi:hypothetical protein